MKKTISVNSVLGRIIKKVFLDLKPSAVDKLPLQRKKSDYEKVVQIIRVTQVDKESNTFDGVLIESGSYTPITNQSFGTIYLLSKKEESLLLEKIKIQKKMSIEEHQENMKLMDTVLGLKPSP